MTNMLFSIEDCDQIATEGLACSTGDLAQQLADTMRENERLREALVPFAKLADRADGYRHEENSSCSWEIKACDLRRARSELQPCKHRVTRIKMDTSKWE